MMSRSRDLSVAYELILKKSQFVTCYFYFSSIEFDVNKIPYVLQAYLEVEVDLRLSASTCHLLQ